jgi:hypothetical protein
MSTNQRPDVDARSEAAEAQGEVDRGAIAGLEAQGEVDRGTIAGLEAQGEVDRVLILQLEAEGEISRDKIANLERALSTARQIGTAMGVLMASYKLTEEQAFTQLRQTSQNINRKLREVADNVVFTGALPKDSWDGGEVPFESDRP